MIDFHTYQQIHQLHFRERLSIAKIAAQLHLHTETVSLWLKRPRYEARKPAPRPSQLDPFVPEIQRLLQQHPFTARQIFHRLRESGYSGQYGVVRKRVRALRPPVSKAFLSLQFLPGQCSQVDWGHAGWMQIGSTRRRVSFLVLMLCHSRKMYVEFTLGQTMEQFLSAQQNAFLFMGGLTAEIMVDYVPGHIIDLQGLWNPAKMPQPVLATPDEGFVVLVEHRLAVGLPGVTEDDPEDPGPAPFAILAENRGSETKVHLGFLTGLNLDAPNPVRLELPEGTNEAFDGLVGTLEAEIRTEILIDALGSKPGLDLGKNPVLVRKAV